MKFNKFLLIFVLLFLLSLSFVSAVVPSTGDYDFFVPLFEYETGVTGLLDLSSNGFDGTASGGAAYNANKSAFYFDGVDDYVSTSAGDLITDDFSICAWNNPATIDASHGAAILSKYGGTNELWNYGYNAGGLLQLIMWDGTSQAMVRNNDASATNKLYFSCVTVKRSTTATDLKLYINGSEISNYFSTRNNYDRDYSSAATAIIGDNQQYANADFDGLISGVTVYNKELSATEVSDLFDEGFNYNPFASVVVDSNSSTESTAVVKQVGSVSFINPTTIIASDFNVTVNDTPIYGAYSFNVESNNNNVMDCELFVDSVSRGNVTRSQSSGVLGSVFLQSEVFFLDAGEHDQELICERTSGVGLITVTNAVGIGHFLVDEFNNTLSYNSTVVNSTITNGSVYGLIDSFSINVSNETLTGNLTHNLVVEGSLTYTNNDVSADVLGAYMGINGTNCSFNPRYVSSGGTGSVSIDCIIQNVTVNQTYTIDLYGNGTNATYLGSLVAKNLFLDDREVEGGTGIITGTNFSGASDTRIFNVSAVGNFNHPVANSFLKASYSVLTDTNTEVSFYIKVINGTNFTTNTWSRDYVAGEIGVVTGQDIFEGVPLDPDYEVELWANCGTVGANCQIVGGSSFGYVTDVTSVIFNSFNITAYDVWSNVSLVNFSVVNDAIYNTTNGFVNYFTTNNFTNFTIVANDYFNTSVFNHNTSLDLNQSMRQSDISFEAFEILTNVTISGANFTIDGVTKSVNESFYLSSGSYNVTADAPTYFPVTMEINVSALDNTSYNFSLGNAQVNITPYNFLSGGNVSDFTIFFNYLNGSFSGNYSTNGSSLVASLIQGSFNITFYKSGYLVDSTVIDVNETYFNYSLAVYGLTNVSLNFFDEQTLLSVVDVDFDILGSSFSGSFNSNTSNTYFLSDLPEDIYQIRYTADDYSARSYYVVIPLTSGSFANLSLYLVNDSVDSIFTRNVVGQDAIPLDGSYLEIQRPYASTDNTSLIYRTMEIAVIDSQGDAVFSAIPNTQQYRFRILDDDLNLLNTLTPSFLIDTTGEIIADESLSTMIDYNTAVDIVGSVYFQNSTGYFVFDYTSPVGVSSVCLRVTNSTGYSSSYVETCSSDQSGTIAILVDTNLSVTYSAWGYAVINGQDFSVDTDTLDLRYQNERDALTYIGPFLYFLAVLLFGAMSFLRPVVGILGLVAVTAAFSLSFLGLFWFSSGLVGGLMVLGIIIAIVAERRS